MFKKDVFYFILSVTELFAVAKPLKILMQFTTVISD